MHEGNLTEPAGLDDLLALDPVLPAALLRARLNDLLGRLDDAHHLGAFFDRVRDRLLDIDVLARLNGVERHHLVPVIRRADQDGVDLAVVEDAPVLGRLERGRAGNLRGLEESRLEHVTDRDDFDAGDRLELAHQPARPAAGADDRDADAGVGALNGRGGRRGAQREAGSRGEEHAPRAVHV